MVSNVQSILIDKNFFSLNEAKEWLLKHGHHIYKVDDRGNFYRFRQINPIEFEHFFTKKIEPGVEFVIGY
jgi:hypothetical protein